MSRIPPHDRAHLLSLRNLKYRKCVREFFTWQMSQEGEDITTKFLFAQRKPKVTARIVARQKGILAGTEEIEYFLKIYGKKIQVRWGVKNGEEFSAGEDILYLSGNAAFLLKTERVLLNVLARLSGIATVTKRISKKLPKNVFFAATRKTPWGVLDKKAVAAGGGLTHRLGLSDAILVKENHLACFPKGIRVIAKKLHRFESLKDRPAFFEIEVESPEEFFTIFNVLKNATGDIPAVIMFDNFRSKKITEILGTTSRRECQRKQIFFEASGGITGKNFLEFAKTGVDVVSASFLTQSVQAIDFSMEISDSLENSK